MTAAQELFDLAGRVALVTGGSSGLGRRIGLALARAGAAVVLLARRAEMLDEARREIEAAGGRAASLAGDVADTAAIDGLAEAAAEPFGAPDILVNAAGVNLRQPPAEVTIDAWNRTLALNLTAPFFLARALLPGMQEKRWGKIVNLASLQSCRAFANGIAYGASKGGIVQLTRAMAEAWSRYGITCNALAPGFFPTELTAPLYADLSKLETLAAQTAIGRNGELSDIDGPAVFLAAPASDYITGQVIFVDGGFTAK